MSSVPPANSNNSAAQTQTDSNAAASALTTLSGNFTDFLSLLTTQLQNQDPTSPMDTTQFTSELVQFTGVEQQINTNASLTSLIQATQGSEVIQASALVGKQVTVSATQVPLQNSSATLDFNTDTAEPVTISITDSKGNDVKDISGTSAAGDNTFTWDGTNNAGVTQKDGVYNVTITSSTGGSAAATIPFTVTGVATGVTDNNGAVDLTMGDLSVPFSNIVNVTPASASGNSDSGGSGNNSSSGT